MYNNKYALGSLPLQGGSTVWNKDERMNQRTLRITYGAMLIAIFGAILLVNRQTGGLLNSVILYILPIPIVAYAVKYGGKASCAVFFCMLFVSFIFGSFTSTFFGVSAALIGLVYGTCLYHKVDMTKTLIAIIILTVAVELADIYLVAAFTGIGLDQDIQEIQIIFTEVAERSGVELPATVMETGSLRRLLLTSVAFLGILEGFVIYGLTLVVLKKLRIPVQKLTPITEIYPPKWSGLLGAAVWLWYSAILSRQEAIAQGLIAADGNTWMDRIVRNELAVGVTQVVGTIGYLYVLIFGLIAVSMLVSRYITRNKGLVAILTVMSFVMSVVLVVFLGAYYISGSLHERLMMQGNARQSRRQS